MANLALILCAQKSQSRLIVEYFAMRSKLEWVELESSQAYTDWNKTNSRSVSAIFVTWDFIHNDPDLMASLRSGARTRWAKIFLLCPQEEMNWIQQLSRAGDFIDSLLIKPYRIDSLKQKIERVCRLGPSLAAGALVIEPGVDERDLIRESLSILGFAKVFEATGLAEAKELIRDHRSQMSVVISAWDEGAINGLDVLSLIKSDSKTLSLPVILCASQAAIDKVRHYQNLGLTSEDCLVTPFELDKFPAIMDKTSERVQKSLKVEKFLDEARLFLERGNLEHAVNVLQHGLQTFPDEGSLHESLGDAIGALAKNAPDRAKEAVLAYEKAVKLEPLNAFLISKSAECYLAHGKNSEVVRMMKNRLMRCTLDDRMRTELGKVYLKIGDYGAGTVELRRALVINPFNSEAQSLLQVAADLELHTKAKAA